MPTDQSRRQHCRAGDPVHRDRPKELAVRRIKAGGERAAAIYSVIETAKLNGTKPQTYITDIIAKNASDWPAARWNQLMPRNWRPVFLTIAEAA